MRIILTTLDPPDPSGNPGKAWVYMLVKGLVERGHDVAFWCVATGENAERARPHLANLPLEWHICQPVTPRRSLFSKFETLFRPLYSSIPEEMRSGVLKACQQGYDVLHFDYDIHGYLGLGSPRSLVAAHGLAQVEFHGTGFRSWEYFKRKQILLHAEKKLLRSFHHIRVLTDRLGTLVREINSTAQIYTVPLAIDPAFYPMVGPSSSEKVVGLIADMRWPRQQRAAARLITSIWPRVRERVKDARLLVAGWNARQSLAAFQNEPGVTLWENVPHASDFFRKCAVFAFPASQFPGLNSKTLESMAYGVPIVTTWEGFEGVTGDDGVHAFIADDDDLFADRVVHLLEDPSLRCRMAQSARQLLEEKYSPTPVISQIEAMYQAITAGS